MSRFPVSPCARAAAMALVLVSSSSSAQAPPPPDARAPGLPHVVEQGVSSSTRISLEVGQDRLLELSFPLRSMSIPNPDAMGFRQAQGILHAGPPRPAGAAPADTASPAFLCAGAGSAPALRFVGGLQPFGPALATPTP